MGGMNYKSFITHTIMIF